MQEAQWGEIVSFLSGKARWVSLLSVKAALDWNSVPETLKEPSSKNSFKDHLVLTFVNTEILKSFAACSLMDFNEFYFFIL